MADIVNLASTTIRIEGDRVTVSRSIVGPGLGRMAEGSIFVPGSGGTLVDPERLAARAEPLAGHIARHSGVDGAGGAACAAGPTALESTSDGDVRARTVYDCAGIDGPLLYRSRIMPETGYSGASESVNLWRDGQRRELAVLGEGNDRVAITEPPPRAAVAVFAHYVAIGVEHIFIGYDHIAFILAVLLWARRIGPLIKIVTAFTVAHSITLTLAVLELVVLPPWIVEPLIALTIVIVGAENFVSRRLDRRWIGTFALGLIHGFGFAGVLTELGLPPDALAVALAGFNIGVEIGQAAIVCAAVPLLLAIDRLTARRGAVPARSPALVYALSTVLVMLGGWWLAERTVLA